MYTLFRTSGLAFMLSCIVILTACEQAVEHLAPAVNPRDSVPTMVTYGVNTLISDSGIVKYRIVRIHRVGPSTRVCFSKNSTKISTYNSTYSAIRPTITTNNACGNYVEGCA